MYMYRVHAVPKRPRRGHQIIWNWSYRQALEMKPGSSARATSALSLWAISSPLCVYVKVYFLLDCSLEQDLLRFPLLATQEAPSVWDKMSYLILEVSFLCLFLFFGGGGLGGHSCGLPHALQLFRH